MQWILDKNDKQCSAISDDSYIFFKNACARKALTRKWMPFEPESQVDVIETELISL